MPSEKTLVEVYDGTQILFGSLASWLSQDGSEGGVVFVTRLLQTESSDSRGRTVLMVLYLCVLAMCFITPIVYYCRIQCEERYGERLRELEAAGIAVAMEQSQQQNREETRAVRRKYMEERRARIRQLFVPTKMTLRKEHFVRDESSNDVESGGVSASSVDPVAVGTNTTSTGDSNLPGTNDETIPKDENSTDSSQSSPTEYPYGDDETLMIRIPLQGLFTERKNETRLVPGMCTICLSVYEVGSKIVWSSNSSCEHVFHEECIETWLMKQREGPLCPCCRRDFIVDPFDMEDGMESDVWIQRTLSEEDIPRQTPARDHV